MRTVYVAEAMRRRMADTSEKMAERKKVEWPFAIPLEKKKFVVFFKFEMGGRYLRD